MADVEDKDHELIEFYDENGAIFSDTQSPPRLSLERHDISHALYGVPVHGFLDSHRIVFRKTAERLLGALRPLDYPNHRSSAARNSFDVTVRPLR